MFPNQNPIQLALAKYMHSLLQQRYSANANIISRINHYIVTESDLRELFQLMNDVYEIAYTKALKDYQTQLAANGIKVALNYSTKNQTSKEGFN